MKLISTTLYTSKPTKNSLKNMAKAPKLYEDILMNLLEQQEKFSNVLSRLCSLWTLLSLVVDMVF